MKILVTGSTGFIGKNVIKELQLLYTVTAPTRQELDLLDYTAVRQFLKKNRFDVIIHLATPTSRNPIDKYDELFERSLRVFTALLHCNELYGKMVYIGSGAEYGKHRDIINAKEDDFGIELPRDPYGLSRYVMYKLILGKKNVYNLRVFGCYGNGDLPIALFQHIISSIRTGKQIELRQNTIFDFLYVKDIIPVLVHFIENGLKHNVYNMCLGKPMLIGDIAKELCMQMKAEIPIIFKRDGYGLEYTGNNERLCSEIKNWRPRSIGDGIKEIVEYENRKF